MKIEEASKPRGIALIIVMISIFVLTVLAGGFAYSMKVETKLARNRNSETELEWLGRSGVEYARWILAQQMMIPNEPYDALSQVWAGGPGGFSITNSALMNVQKEVHLGSGSFTWTITDLERKMNINIANEAILQQALTAMTADAGEITPVVNSILDWIDKDDDPRIQGTESDTYKNMDPPYQAKNGPIDDISELLLIRGVTPELYWGTFSTNHPPGAFQQHYNRLGMRVEGPQYPFGLVDLFTPMSTGKLNINTASSAALQAIPGLDALTADAIVGARGGEDDGSGQTGPFRNIAPQYLWSRVPGLNLEVARGIQMFCDVRSKTFEVQINAQINGYSRQFTAILGRNSPRDIQVLTFYWK